MSTKRKYGHIHKRTQQNRTEQNGWMDGCMYGGTQQFPSRYDLCQHPLAFHFVVVAIAVVFGWEREREGELLLCVAFICNCRIFMYDFLGFIFMNLQNGDLSQQSWKLELFRFLLAYNKNNFKRNEFHLKP